LNRKEAHIKAIIEIVIRDEVGCHPSTAKTTADKIYHVLVINHALRED